MRDVENATLRIAERHGNAEFIVSPSRLSDIETKGLVPSIYRVYSLAAVYHRDLREILSWYGIDLELGAADLSLNLPPKSYVSEFLQAAPAVHIPTRLDPSFDPRRTANLSRMVEEWGLVPVAYLSQLLTHEEMAQMIGSSRETVTRLLSELKKKELIRLEGSTLVIRNRTALEALAA